MRTDGYCAGTEDCNDTNPAIHPGSTETCDGQDNDCDGVIDEDCSACTDEDGDGFCDDVDCDDMDATITRV